MPTSKSDFLKKLSFSLGTTMILRVQGIEVGRKNLWKIIQKTESRWEGILASIFNGFWWIFGGKLGGKMEPRSIQEGIEKAMEKWKAPRWSEDRKKTLRGAQDTPRISPKTAQDASQDGPSGSTWHSTSPLFGRWISKSHSTSHSTSGPQAVTPLKRGDRVI